MWLPMRDRRVRPSAALVTLGMERIFDMAALVCFFAINLLFFTPQPGREHEFHLIEYAGWLLLAGVVVGFAMLIVYQRHSTVVITWFEKLLDRKWIPSRLSKIFISILQSLDEALAILKSWRQTFWVTFWTLMLWFCISLPTWFVLLAFDMPISFTDSLFIMGFASLASVIPTPGGAAGAFHASTAASILFLRNDIPTEDAAAMSFVMHLVYFAPAIVFGLYYFFRGDISIERFRSLLSSENAVDEIESDSPDFEKDHSESVT